MKSSLPADKPTFQKTDIPCLYRYTGNDVYYALAKHAGKQVRKSLETTDKIVAKRKLSDFQRDLGKVDSSQGRTTLAALCKRYMLTVANGAAKTVRGKVATVERLLADFPLGPDCQVSKIKPSDLQAWIESYRFKYASYNHYAEVIRGIFSLAVRDKIIITSPAADIKSKKIVRPIRLTPTFEDFNAIVSDVRAQKFNARADESADYLLCMGLLGVGQAEASGIQKQHVNTATQQLTFFRVKTKTPYTIPIFGQASELIKKLINRPGMKQTDYLFPVDFIKEGESNTVKRATKALTNACKRLGLPAYTHRALRRMFITRCIEKGIDVKVIAQWQGHQDGGKLILGTYSHVRNVHAEEMAKKLV